MASIRVEQTGKQQTFPEFHAFKYGLAKPSTSLNLKILHAILLTQGAQPTPRSSAQKIASPRYGGHLGRGIWQRLPRFPPSSVIQCHITQTLASA